MNSGVSRRVVYSLEEAAVAVLYVASRLRELPLGILTVAVATGGLPLWARGV